jgi:hypothetical protein
LSGFDHFLTGCQILQIYNEKIYDLLTDRKRKNPLPLREFGDGSSSGSSVSSSVHVRGISVYQTDTKEDAIRLIKSSMKNKAIRSTDYNNVSSRSHTVVQFSIHVEEANRQTGIKLVRRSTLSLIDLAGSEKWRPSLSTVTNSSVNPVLSETDQQVKEMTNINTSLHVLGNCIAKLIEPDSKHIPFRDSVLTRLLQGTLSGNGKSVIVGTIHSDSDYMEENYSTLQFANRASRVKVTLTANVGISEQISLVEAQKHIKLLQQQLFDLKSSSGPTTSLLTNHEENHNDAVEIVKECQNCSEMNVKLIELEKRLSEVEKENRKLKEKNKKLKETIQSLQNGSIPQQQQHFSQSQLPLQNEHQATSYYPPSHGTSTHFINPSLTDSHVTSNASHPVQKPSFEYQHQHPQYLGSPPPDYSQQSQFHQLSNNYASSASHFTSSNYHTSDVGVPVSQGGPSVKKLTSSGKCKKHSLEDCVLCSMFGEPSSSALSPTHFNHEKEEPDNMQSVISSYMQRTKTPKTPYVSDYNSNYLDEDDFGDIDKKREELNSASVCKTHSLRNCLLCTNEFTFQKGIQFTGLNSLKSQPDPPVIGFNTNSNVKLTPLSESTTSDFLLNKTGFVSTLESAESSHTDYGFTSSHLRRPHSKSSTTTSSSRSQFPAAISTTSQNKEVPYQYSNPGVTSGFSSSSALYQNNGSNYNSQQPPPQSLKDLSPHDMVTAALNAANSLLSTSGDNFSFSVSGNKSHNQGEGFSTSGITENKSASHGLKSKRLRELKALSTQSLGNTTSPGNIESTPDPFIPPNVIPRRSSSSPAPNYSIPIEPFHQSQSQRNQHYPPSHHPSASQYQLNNGNYGSDIGEPLPLSDEDDDSDNDGDDRPVSSNYPNNVPNPNSLEQKILKRPQSKSNLKTGKKKKIKKKKKIGVDSKAVK